MVGDKHRIRFGKGGDLRLLSHLDLTRCFERMLRRAALPFKSSAGFHPSPRMIFALSLPLGVVGRDEVLELELTEPLDSDAVLARLNSQAPHGLSFHAATVVPMKLTAMPRRVVYRLPLDSEQVEPARAAAIALMNQDKLWADRQKPRPRRVNIRPYLRGINVIEATRRADAPRSEDLPEQRASALRGSFILLLDIWVTATGSARADELIALLGLTSAIEAGTVMERYALALHDETFDATDAPPEGPPETLPLETPAGASPADIETSTAAATWGLSPHGPVVE